MIGVVNFRLHVVLSSNELWWLRGTSGNVNIVALLIIVMTKKWLLKMCGGVETKCFPERTIKRLFKLILLQIKPYLIQFSLQLQICSTNEVNLVPIKVNLCLIQNVQNCWFSLTQCEIKILFTYKRIYDNLLCLLWLVMVKWVFSKMLLIHTC